MGCGDTLIMVSVPVKSSINWMTRFVVNSDIIIFLFYDSLSFGLSDCNEFLTLNVNIYDINVATYNKYGINLEK